MADLLEELESPRDLAPLPEEEGEEEEESFGSRTAKGRGAPRGPTEKERAEHNLTHLPYRSWCPACVAGREAAIPLTAHVRQDGQLLEIDVIDVAEIDEQGRVLSMRAFFDLEGARRIDG